MEEIYYCVESSEWILRTASLPSSALPAALSGKLTSSLESVESHWIQFAVDSSSLHRNFETKGWDKKQLSLVWLREEKN